MTRIRLQLQIPRRYIDEPILSNLISCYGLTVNISRAFLPHNTNYMGSFDLEIQGNLHQLSQGLAYLDSLQLKVISKPNLDGDGWDY
ncbi:NIL domain-containing protein [Alkalinema pantanalense CENA528]|uniref:NIL domain-containing protein n=1 Tax=Alkalinema pantanalense TaxID=1620705 RepID=UPI003D6EC2A4